MDLKKTGLTVQNTEDLNFAFFPKIFNWIGAGIIKTLAL